MGSEQAETKREAGTCPVCDRWLHVTEAGVLHVHGNYRRYYPPCAGSGQKCKEDQADA